MLDAICRLEIINYYNMRLQKQRLSMEELVKRDQLIINRICSDDKYAYYFFHEKCRPLFNNIIWKIYGNNADYDELVNEIYIYLKEPIEKDNQYWHRLRTFNFRTSLFDWIKTVAIRQFYTPSRDVFKISPKMIDLGVAEELILEIRIAKYRNFLYYSYIKKLSEEQLIEMLSIEKTHLSSLSRNAIKYFKNYLKNNRPEFFTSFFKENKSGMNNIEIDPTINITSKDNENVEFAFDVQRYLAAMPNPQYRSVVKSIYLEGKQPEELAKELDTTISNIYNIKSRGLDQLRDIVILSGDIENLEKYINLMVNDRNRLIIRSIFIDKEDYDSISLKLGLSASQFKRERNNAMKELKSLIFK